MSSTNNEDGPPVAPWAMKAQCLSNEVGEFCNGGLSHVEVKRTQNQSRELIQALLTWSAAESSIGCWPEKQQITQHEEQLLMVKKRPYRKVHDEEMPRRYP